MKIMAIGSHPDDIEWGCGGTLIKCAKQGDEIAMVVMTSGEKGGDSDVRRAEQKEAAKFVGATKLYHGVFPDTKIEVNTETIGFIEDAIADFQPDEVLVNSPEDTHQDHRYVSQCALVAARKIHKVLFYEDFTSVKFVPSIYVKIDDYLEDKIKLLSYHQSQVQASFATGLIEGVKSVATYHGYQAGVNYAEGFIPFRYLINE